MTLNATPNTNGHVPQPIAGHATPEATAAYRDRFPEIARSYHSLGVSTGLTCSVAGFGTYRVDARVQAHRAALAAALRSGVNLIDSSANYADGMSEKLVGEVLRELIGLGTLKREEVIVITKGGYIQGENYERIHSLAEKAGADISPGSEYAELTRYGNNLWHSIHPAFLKDQITRSLERLQLRTVDGYLLHNPEYYVQWAIREGVPEDEARTEYERRIEQAFDFLETEVERGRIRFYGISSNTFPRAEESIDRTSLEHALRSAERVARNGTSPEHHFKLIQLPLNLLETGGVAELNHSRASESVIQFARKNGIGVIVNRPLNAIVAGTLLRLADFPEREHPPEDDIDILVHDLALQEEEFKTGILKDISLNPQAYDAVKQLLSLGQSLDEKWSKLNSYEEWRDLSQTVLAPRIQYAFDLLRPIAHMEEKLFKFLTDYAETADEVMEHVSNYYSTIASSRSHQLHDVLDQILPDRYEGLSLSQKALLVVRSVPGVSSVLVGMRSEEYVEDVINGLQAEELPDAEDILKRLALKERS